MNKWLKLTVFLLAVTSAGVRAQTVDLSPFTLQCVGGGGGSSLTVKESDGSPSLTATTLSYTNCTVVDSGNGVATLTCASSTTPAGSGTELQSRNGSSFAAVTNSSVSGANVTLGGVLTLAQGAAKLTFGTGGAGIDDYNSDGQLGFNGGGSRRMDLVDIGGGVWALRMGSNIKSNGVIDSVTQLTVDNIGLDGNTLSTTSGALTIAPASNGNALFSSTGTFQIADATVALRATGGVLDVIRADLANYNNVRLRGVYLFNGGPATSATESFYANQAGDVGTISTGRYTFSNATTNPESPDTGISRISAGVVGIGTGAQGSAAGAVQAATFSGGTTSGGNIQLQSTSHATKGQFLFDSTAGLKYVSGNGGLTFTDGSTGISWADAAGFGVVTNQTSAFIVKIFDSGSGIGQVRLGVNGDFVWTDTADTNGSQSAGLSKCAAGVVCVDTSTRGNAAGVVKATQFSLVPQATAPATCSQGDLYFDTSGAYCACTSTNTWTNTSGVGTCA